MSAPSTRGTLDPARASVPSDADPLVAAASEVIGGPLGRHAQVRTRRWGGRGPRRRLTVLPSRPIAAVLAFFAAGLVAFGVVQKGYCLTNGWGGAEVFWHACYSDLPRLYVTSGLITGSLPYSEAPGSLNQPVGTGLLLWALAQFVPVGPREATWFVGLWAVVAALLAAGLTAMTAVTLRRDPWRAAQVALCPLLVTVVLIGPELLGVALVGLGLLLWSRDRMVWAGVAFGLAMSARSYAVFVVLVLVMIAARAGVLRRAARLAGTALLTWLAVLLAVGAAGGSAVLTPYRSWLAAGPEFGAPIYLLQLARVELPLGAVTAVAIAGWIVALLVGAVCVFVPARRPAVAEVLVVVLVVVLLTGKSIPVQATLVLVPIVALARVPWRDVVVWWGAETCYFVAVWLYLGGQDDAARALPAGWYALFLALRCAALAYLAVVVLRSALRRPAAPTPDELLAAEFESASEPGPGEDAGAEFETDERALAARDDPDDVAGPAAGRPDALVATFG